MVIMSHPIYQLSYTAKLFYPFPISLASVA